MKTYCVNEKKHFIEFSLSKKTIYLTKPKGIFARKTGLLNHYTLSEYEGIAYKKIRLFHTFGMKFPISLACFDKSFNLVSNPIVVNVNSVFIVPKKTYYVFEMNKNICELFEVPQNLKKITLFSERKARVLFYFLKHLKIAFILLFLTLFSYSIYAQDEIKIPLGKTRVLDLGKPPLTIQIADPDVLEVERIGITNSIKIIPKQEGVSKITVAYAVGEELNWNVSVGNKNKSYASSSIEPLFSGMSNHKLNSGSYIFIKKINKISGLKASPTGEKIIILGEIKNYNSFIELSKIISANPTLFFPAFDIPAALEVSIISALQSDLRLFGERNLKIISRRGIFTLVGVPATPAGRLKAWNYLTGLIPNIVDAMSAHVGESSLVQINLDFLELAKGEGTEFGFSQPLFSNMSADLNFPAALISKAIQEPTLQIGSITTLFKSLQTSSFARELAKPVVITRSGEKASFLAGGEVPIVTATSTSAATTSSVTYKPFGILFNVTPRVQVDGSIWIKLDLEVSQISEDLSYQNIPGFTSRKINTNIILNEGNTALLSGLVQNRDVKHVQKIPLLGSIPIIGELFKSRRFQENTTELWVAITAMRGDREQTETISSKSLEDKFNAAKNHVTGSLLD